MKKRDQNLLKLYSLGGCCFGYACIFFYTHSNNSLYFHVSLKIQKYLKCLPPHNLPFSMLSLSLSSFIFTLLHSFDNKVYVKGMCILTSLCYWTISRVYNHQETITLYSTQLISTCTIIWYSWALLFKCLIVVASWRKTMSFGGVKWRIIIVCKCSETESQAEWCILFEDQSSLNLFVPNWLKVFWPF